MSKLWNHVLTSLAEGSETEVFSASFDTLEVGFSAGSVKRALARESSGLGLRALEKGKLGFDSNIVQDTRVNSGACEKSEPEPEPWIPEGEDSGGTNGHDR